MNAKQFNELLEKYKIGHVRLEKEFADEGDNSVVLRIVDDNGDYVEANDKLHFNCIEVDDSSFAYEQEGEITDQDYENYQIDTLQFYTTAWAYPNSYINEIDGGLDVAERNCGIRLTAYKMFENQESNLELYTEQAIKMWLDPMRYQNWLLKEYVNENDKFTEHYYPILEKYGYWLKESDIYKRGFESEYRSEIYLEFVTKTGVSNLYIHQDLFTGKFVIEVNGKEPIKDSEFSALGIQYPHYIYNVNEMSDEDFIKIIEDKFENSGEYFWREEREFREKYNKEHGFGRFAEDNSSYSLDMFLKYKTGKTQKELLEETTKQN